MMLPPVEPAVPYDAIRPQLGTGDLFFLHTCSTQGMWIERIEQSFGLAPLSHVGMVIKDDHEDEKLFLWDAPGGGDCFADPYVADTDNRLHGSSEEHPGCRVSVLDHVLAYYSTKVDVPGFWMRRLTQPASPQQFGALREFVNRVDGLPFPIEHGYLGLAENFAAGQNRKRSFSARTSAHSSLPPPTCTWACSRWTLVRRTRTRLRTSVSTPPTSA